MPLNGPRKSCPGGPVNSSDKYGPRWNKEGFDLELTRSASESVEVPVIASGGVGNPAHMADGIINGKASAVLAASIFHFGECTIPETKQVMRDAGIPVRL